MCEKTIKGYVAHDGTRVIEIDDRKIPLHREVVDHSRAFEWGYIGSGPMQAAVAILHELFGPDIAKKLRTEFRDAYMSGFAQGSSWSIPCSEIREWVESLEGKPFGEGTLVLLSDAEWEIVKSLRDVDAEERGLMQKKLLELLQS